MSLTNDQLIAIAAGRMSVADALKVSPVEVKSGCCSGVITQRAPSGGKLHKLLEERKRRMSTMTTEELAALDARILKLYKRWDRNNGGRMSKSIDGRRGYLVETDPALPKLHGGYVPPMHSVGKRRVKVAKGVSMVMPGYGDSEGSARPVYHAPRHEPAMLKRNATQEVTPLHNPWTLEYYHYDGGIHRDDMGKVLAAAE